MPVKVVVCGAGGRMGARIIELGLRDAEIKIVGAIESPEHPRMGDAVAEVRITDSLEAVIGGADVVVDFTTARATVANASAAAKAGKALVIGTTGFEADEVAVLRQKIAAVPCVFTPNMSVGVNILFKMAELVAKALPGFEVEIIEAHHSGKTDAPSGTANKLAQIIASALKRNIAAVATYGRRGMARRKPEEIGIHAVRMGDVVGEHTVIFAGSGERLELVHRATSRDTFVLGALRAAKWVVGKPPGLYDMADVLGLK